MAGMVVLFQGRRGSGKTLSMTFWSTYYKRLGWRVFSNYSLSDVENLVEDDLLNLDKGSDLKNCLILIDEMQIFFDSRLWKNEKHISFSHFIQQLRKRNIIILGTTQYIDTIEKRIRQHVDLLVKPRYNDDFKFCSNQVYDLTTAEDSDEIDSYVINFNARRVFDLYDTNEILK